MTIRILKRWNGYRVGQEITPADGVANTLIRRGFAIAVASPIVETATADGGVERAVGFRQRHKGR
jgi:hypothetical protein